MRISGLLSVLRAACATPRRIVIFMFGLLVMLGGGSALAYAVTADGGPAPSAARHATVTTTAATKDTAASLAGDGLSSVIDALKSLDNVDELAAATPFGQHDKVNAIYQKVFGWLADAQKKVQDDSTASGETLTKLEKQLDDIDGDGNPKSDIHVAGLTGDLDATITPKDESKPFDVTFTLDIKADQTGPLSYLADGITIGGQKIDTDLVFSFGTTIHVDPSAKKITIPAGKATLGSVGLAVKGGYDGSKNPLAFAAGLLQVSATGSLDADAGMSVSMKDANKDGVIDMTELSKPGKLLSASCTSKGADVDLTVNGTFAGLGTKVGSIRVHDKDICDGLSTPDVELGDMSQFRNMTLGDLINGLAQVTQAVQAAQAAGDLDLPFLKESLSSVVSVNEKFVKFFVDNGFTDPKNPMTNITVDTSSDAAIQSLQQLAPKLASALGLPANSLDMHYANGRVLFTLQLSTDPAALPNAGTLDFGDTFKSDGIAGLSGSAKATIDPKYKLDLGFGFDLGQGLPLDQRFFLTNGTDGNIFSLDADVTADLDLTGTASAASVEMRDSNDNGAVTLLKRKDSSKPMLAVKLVDPNNDGRTTLAEMAASVGDKQLPVAASVNASVPSTDLLVSANVVGVPIASGKVTVAWPSVPDTTGAGALTVTGDASFNNTLLPMSFDTSDPQALISQVLTSARETITRMRAAIANGDATTTKPLPIVGQSVADLDPVLAKVQSSLDDLIATNDLLTLKALQTKLNSVLASALGLPAGQLANQAAPDIVTLTYEPATAAKQAAIVVGLKLGACSTDRAENRTGCTVTGAPLNEPFNLQLGTGSKIGGIAGIGTTGTVKVSYDARANLTFGVLLPTVKAGATAGDGPQVTGSPALFVQDDSSMDIGLGVKLDGILHVGLGPIQADLGKTGSTARAGVGVRFGLKASNPTGKRLIVGSADFNTFMNNLVPKSGASVHETDSKLQATCPGVSGQVDACASLPVYVDNTSLGTITFSAPDLLAPNGWSFDSSQVEAKLSNQAVQFSLVVDGVRMLAEQLQQGLRSLPAGTKIPLIGTDVTAGADVIQKFNDAVLGKVQDFADALDEVATTGGVKAKAEEILNSISIVKDGAKVSVAIKCKDGANIVDCTGDEEITELQSFEVHLPLGFEVSGASSAFDIGFPGLRLSSEGGVKGSAGLDVNLAFGFDRDLGFYIPTKGTEPEVALTAKANMPNVAGKPDLKGQLAFLPIAIEDNHDGDDVSVTAGIDLTTSRTDGRLTLQDLGSAQLSPTLKANAAVHLGVTTTKPDNMLSALPTFSADVNIDASVDWDGSSNTDPSTNASIKFDNVAIDAGSLVSDFIKPMAHQLHTYTEPLEKPIEAIKKPIPGVAEAARAAGRPAPSWYDLFKAVDDATRQPGQTSGLQMIDRVMGFVDFVKALDKSDLPAGQIPLGSFTVLPDVASQPVPLDDAGQLVGSSTLKTDNVLKGLSFKGSKALDAETSSGGLSFPAFQHPLQLFQLLLGKDVPLVYFDAGKLQVKRGFQFSYPLGPARLYIGGSGEVDGHFAAGFDTYGLRKAFQLLSDDDPTNDGVWDIAKGLLQGLYIDDNDQSGKDVPEITLQAELTAGASIGLPGFEAGAEGGIHGEVDFNLHTTPEQQGKERYTDIAKQLAVNPNPLCFFDASANVDAFIRAYVDTPLGRADYPIASTTVYSQPDLFQFCHTPVEDKPHLLADVTSDGTMIVKTDDSAQDITMTQVAAHSVEISGNGIDETYDKVNKVYADLKGGDDLLQISRESGVQAALPVTLCGGAGNDTVSASTGPATLFGDSGGGGCAAVPAALAGADTLQGGSSEDKLDGGPGDDALVGGDGADALNGADGNDVLRGGLGDDTLQGGAGSDTTDYSDHTGAVTINLPGPSGSVDEKDTATEVENVVGGSAKDTVNLPATGSYRVDGGTGDDLIKGDRSTVLVMGSDGNDTFVGGKGAAQIVAGDGDDTFVDGPGAQTFLGQGGADTADYSASTKPVSVSLDGVPDDGPLGSAHDDIVDADVVVGSEFDDHLVGGSAGEDLRGGKGTDHLEGGPGGDTLHGGDDADALEGGSGNDALLGEKGTDTLYGGTGSDDMSGGAGADLVDYSDRTEALTITKDDAANDGAASDTWKDNVHTDVETVVGGSGSDHLGGYAGADVLKGGPGLDYLEGHGGPDTFIGGDGNDELYDRSFNERWDVGTDSDSDTFDGGDGNDWAHSNGGSDVFTMGAGNDVAYGNTGTDTMHGDDGDDQLHGGDAVDTVYGDNGDDTITGDAGDDVLRGGNATTGQGVIRGGAGNDTIYNAKQGGTVYTGDGGLGHDIDNGPNTVYGYGGESTYYGSLGNDVFHLGAGDDTVHANLGDDIIELGDGDNRVEGEAGNDTVTGGAGTDVLFGGDGNDTMHGGAGRDTIEGGNGNDTLYGEADDDYLYGEADDDYLDGGTQADEIYGGEGVDTVTYADRTEAITLKEDGNHTDGGKSDKSSRPDSTYYDYVNYDNEILIGGSGNDSFSIGAGARKGTATMDGGAGNDTLVTRSAIPTTFIGGVGSDTMQGGSGNDTFVQGSAPDGADDMTGGAGSDTVDYSKRPAKSVSVSKDNVANDGAKGEKDNVHDDIEKASMK